MSEYAKEFIVISDHGLSVKVSHNLMRFKVVTGLISGAVISAHTALDAAAFCSIFHRFSFKVCPGYKMMIFGENDDVTISFGDNKFIDILFLVMYATHHRSTHDYCIVGNGGASCFYASTNGSSERYGKHNRMFYFTYNAEEFVGNRFALESINDVENSTDVVNNSAYHKRNSSFGNRFTGDFANDYLLVTSRVEIAHFVEFDVASGFSNSFFESSNFSFVCCFKSYVLFVSAELLSNHVNTFYKVCCSGTHEELIGFDKGLTLCCVDNEILGFSVQFYMGRKTCAARTDYTGILYGFD